MNKPLATLVATAHNEDKPHCPFIDSMLAQKDPMWKMIVFHNGPNETMKEWVESYNDSRITYEQSDTDTGMWGCVNRQAAITHIVDTPYIINTSIQDYYLPNAVAEINNVLLQQPDLVTWQAINHLFRYGVLTGEIAFGHIDWGQWCVRTEHIKATGIQKMDQFAADWHTLNTIAQSGAIRVVHKIDKILTIHN